MKPTIKMYLLEDIDKKISQLKLQLAKLEEERVKELQERLKLKKQNIEQSQSEIKKQQTKLDNLIQEIALLCIDKEKLEKGIKKAKETMALQSEELKLLEEQLQEASPKFLGNIKATTQELSK